MVRGRHYDAARRTKRICCEALEGGRRGVWGDSVLKRVAGERGKDETPISLKPPVPRANNLSSFHILARGLVGSIFEKGKRR